MLLLVVAGVIGIVVWKNREQEEYVKTGSPACKKRLNQIAIYCQLYEHRYRCPPATLRDLYAPDMAYDPGVFVCPVGKGPLKEWAPGTPWESFETQISYEFRPYVRTDRWTKRSGPRRAVIWDRDSHNGGGEHHVLFDNGEVHLFWQDEFRAALKEGESAAQPGSESSTPK